MAVFLHVVVNNIIILCTTYYVVHDHIFYVSSMSMFNALSGGQITSVLLTGHYEFKGLHLNIVEVKGP